MNRSTVAASDRTTDAAADAAARAVVRRGLELDLSLTGIPRGRRTAALTDSLRSAVVAGRLRPSSSLPSSRRLADDLGVSRGVVVEAYAQLVAEGHLVATNAGTRVSPRAPVSAAPVSGVDGRLELPNVGQPDPALFPRHEWLRVESEVVRTLPDADFGYGDAQGFAELRTVLAGYLGRVRGVDVDADRLVVVNGFAQALALLMWHLTRAGETPVVAVEDPGSVGVLEELRAWRMRIVPVAVDGRGLDVDALSRSGASAVVVTPAHQYPTGVTLAPERRVALVDWARSRGAYVIEDNYDAEYRYDRAPLTSLHSLAPDHVLAAGSMSKSLSPALRLGWIATPPALAAALTRGKAMMDLGAPTIPQATLARFIATGRLDRHLRRTRAIYRRRRDALLDALERRGVEGVETVEGIAAGLHVAVRLGGGVDEADLAARARACGLEAQALGRYRHQPGPPGLVLGYGSRSVDAIRRGVDLLASGIQ